ncbi:hypothetical protein MSEN_11090 [Mycolicibacter senuensis]|uniref:Uncharacterized protein n=1 Tax=Mycolicibacter senuensis TaxID=386913 RepID=A0A7I9XHD8_9MYCO|nr:hypothetical protein MSEN_11090 [Mycolicibacter senuensis]
MPGDVGRAGFCIQYAGDAVSAYLWNSLDNLSYVAAPDHQAPAIPWAGPDARPGGYVAVA